MGKRVDEAFVRFRLRAPANPFLDQAAGLLSTLGDRGGIWAATGACAAAAGCVPPSSVIARLAFVALFMVGPHRMLKVLIGRVRPSSAPSRPTWVRPPSDASMPSGHVATSVACAMLLSDLGLNKKMLYSLAGAVAASRLWLGDHYLTDVLVAVLTGQLCARTGRLFIRALSERGLKL